MNLSLSDSESSLSLNTTDMKLLDVQPEENQRELSLESMPILNVIDETGQMDVKHNNPSKQARCSTMISEMLQKLMNKPLPVCNNKVCNESLTFDTEIGRGAYGAVYRPTQDGMKDEEYNKYKRTVRKMSTSIPDLQKLLVECRRLAEDGTSDIQPLDNAKDIVESFENLDKHSRLVSQYYHLFPFNLVSIHSATMCRDKEIPYWNIYMDDTNHETDFREFISQLRKQGMNYVRELHYTLLDSYKSIVMLIYVLSALNQKGIFHRDIKGNNIVIKKLERPINLNYNSLVIDGTTINLTVNNVKYVPIIIDYDLAYDLKMESYFPVDVVDLIGLTIPEALNNETNVSKISETREQERESLKTFTKNILSTFVGYTKPDGTDFRVSSLLMERGSSRSMIKNIRNNITYRPDIFSDNIKDMFLSIKVPEVNVTFEKVVHPEEQQKVMTMNLPEQQQVGSALKNLVKAIKKQRGGCDTCGKQKGGCGTCGKSKIE